MSKHYKIVDGFREDEYLPISGEELPKAIALFMEASGRAQFEHGAMRGQDIKKIVPDWHAALGFNRGYRMNEFDYARTKPLVASYNAIYAKASEIAEFAIKENRRDLLSIPASQAVTQLPIVEQKKQISGTVKELAEKMTNATSKKTL